MCGGGHDVTLCRYRYQLSTWCLVVQKIKTILITFIGCYRFISENCKIVMPWASK